jgi:nucleotide-binding universal stress UspA family protein
MYKKILVPTDDSEHAKRAAKHAKWIALSSEAEILVLNVFETSSLSPIRSRELKRDMKKLWTNEAKENLKGVLKIFNGSDLNVKSKIKEGRPVEAILQTIDDEDIDLVVMGSSGKNAIDRLFIGSVAENVVRSANTAVLVVN